MLRGIYTALVLGIATLATPVAAQEQLKSWTVMPVVMDCASPGTMMTMSSQLGEQPFVAGAARMVDDQNQIMDAWMTFQVNAETNTWNLMMHTYDGAISCLLAAGTDFSAVPLDLQW